MPATVSSERAATPDSANVSALRKSGAIWLFCCALLILGVACGDLSEEDRRSTSNTMADTLLGMTESRDAVIEIFVDGRTRIRATAPRSVTREAQGLNQTDLYGPPVEIAVFDSLGGIETFITCDHATYKPRQHQFEFFGNVVVETGSERVLRTEQLLWDEIGSRFNTSRFVTITTPQDSITGYGFSGDQDLIRYNLSTVTGQFSID